MTRAAIGLGSNLGDRAGNLERAIRSLGELGELVSLSPFYETDPIGGPEQGPYINAVLVIETALPARELLDAMLGAERSLGRERRERWGPRIIDLDLLLFGDEVIDEPGLTVPHPRMSERRFVIQPLLDVWPDAELPDGTRIDSFRAAVADQEVHIARTSETRRLALILFFGTAILAVLLWWLLGLIF